MLDGGALPLAFLAGVVSILSPCVWPLLPMTVSAAGNSGRTGVLALGAGLSLSFAIAGSLLTYVLVQLNINPEFFRYVSASLLLIAGAILVIPALSNAVSVRLSGWMSKANINTSSMDWAGPFGIGMLTGVVWLPCVGPTLGAAIALASTGESLGMAFVTMLMFGLGTASVLVAVGLTSRQVLRKMSGQVTGGANRAKTVLGIVMLVLGLLVLTGGDKALEVWALDWLPEWSVGL